VLTVPGSAKQLDGIYRCIMNSGSDQTIVLPDPEKENVVINNSSGYANGATSMTVDALPQALYSGQTVTFEGEQTFVLSANASAAATTITGKLTAGSTLADNTKGYVYDGTSFRMSIYKPGASGKVDIRVEGFVPTAGTYSGENLTLTLPTGHGITTSDKVTVTGMTPSYYNVVKAQVTNATTTQITYVDQASTSPSGNATGFGLARRSEKLLNNSTGVLSDGITVVPSTADAVNKKVLLHLICDSNRGDGQWLIGGMPSYTSLSLQAEAGETNSNMNLQNLPLSAGYFKVNNGSGYAVASPVAVTVDNTHGITAAIGDKIMFEGGGLLTLTAAVSSATQTPITGNLTLFPVADNERGHLIPNDSSGTALSVGTVYKTVLGSLFITP
jgi:hypothetical protein